MITPGFIKSQSQSQFHIFIVRISIQFLSFSVLFQFSVQFVCDTRRSSQFQLQVDRRRGAWGNVNDSAHRIDRRDAETRLDWEIRECGARV